MSAFYQTKITGMNNRILAIFIATVLLPHCSIAQTITFKPDLHSFSMNMHIGSFNGFDGLGLVSELEWDIVRNGILSTTVAAGVNFSGSFSLSAIKVGDIRGSLLTGYVAPGIRLHPLRNTDQVDIGFGASIPLGYDGYTETSYPNGNYSISKSKNSLFLALVGQLNINVCAKNQKLVGLTINTGKVLSSSRFNTDFDIKKPKTIFQVGVRLGGW